MRAPLTHRRLIAAITTGSAFLLVASLIGIAYGPTDAGLESLFGGDAQSRLIVLSIRLPRVLITALVGGALAAAGVAFQALLRNPLASPYILGVSGGGSLGTVCALLLGIDIAILGISTRPLFAFVGCAAAVGVLLIFSGPRGRIIPHTLILAGVVVNSFFASLIAFVTYVVDPHQAVRIIHWIMGGIPQLSSPAERWAGGIAITIGFIGLLSEARTMNVLTLGDEGAAQMGVDVERVRRRLLFSASLLTAAAVALSGPIGFVGLVVPHAVRLVVGPDHRIVLPVSLLVGGGFLTLAHLVARLVRRPEELPVGIVTAFVGAPFFLALLVRRRGTLHANGGST